MWPARPKVQPKPDSKLLLTIEPVNLGKYKLVGSIVTESVLDNISKANFSFVKL